MPLKININGVVRSADVEPEIPLLWFLRDILHLTGTKFGCGLGLCGACTVHIDGVPTRSCITPVNSIGEGHVTTIEGLSGGAVGRAVQQAWLDLEVVQCGYCQSGQLMSAAALLANNVAPGDPEIDAAMAGNICRCGTYLRIRGGIKAAARNLANAKSPTNK